MDSPFICVYQIRSDPKTTNQLRKKATEKRGFAVFQTDAVLNVAMAVEAKNRKRAMNAAKKEFEALLKDGILFDTGKSDIKPESEKAISSVATFLKENPELNVYIVGHTDNVGDFAMNQKLSKSRGESIKNYLVSKYNIAPNRLTGDGVGPVCPVSSNDTEEGRTLNRRVEIVQK